MLSPHPLSLHRLAGAITIILAFIRVPPPALLVARRTGAGRKPGKCAPKQTNGLEKKPVSGGRRTTGGALTNCCATLQSERANRFGESEPHLPCRNKVHEYSWAGNCMPGLAAFLRWLAVASLLRASSPSSVSAPAPSLRGLSPSESAPETMAEPSHRDVLARLPKIKCIFSDLDGTLCHFDRSAPADAPAHTSMLILALCSVAPQPSCACTHTNTHTHTHPWARSWLVSLHSRPCSCFHTSPPRLTTCPVHVRVQAHGAFRG